MTERARMRRYLAKAGLWIPRRAKVRGRVATYGSKRAVHRVEILPVHSSDRLIRPGKAMLLHDTVWADGTATRYRMMMEEDMT